MHGPLESPVRGASGYTGKMHDPAGRELRPEMFLEHDPPVGLVEARTTLFERVYAHFSAQQVKDGRSAPLWLAVGVYAGPWRWKWEAPSPEGGATEEVRRSLLERTRDRMMTTGALSNDRWSFDAAPGWLGVATPKHRDDLRLYDDLPAVLAISRLPDREAFSALWFVHTVLDAVQFGTATLASVYPEISTLTVLWRFENGGGVPLRVTHPVKNLDHAGETTNIFEVPRVWAWESVKADPKAIAEFEAKHFLDVVHTSYKVPADKRPGIDQARAT
jgi:hypothetical protein